MLKFVLSVMSVALSSVCIGLLSLYLPFYVCYLLYLGAE